MVEVVVVVAVEVVAAAVVAPAEPAAQYRSNGDGGGKSVAAWQQ